MNNLIISYIRTFTPMVIGAFIGWLATLGLNIDESAANGLIVFVSTFFQVLYYFVARQIEKKWPTAGGLLLGSSKLPTYRS